MPFDFVPSGRAALAVEESGDGPAAMFLHAGVADRRSWEGLLALLDLQLRAIRYDRRGFGDTLFEEEPFSHLTDLEAVLHDRDVCEAILVGNSQGGRIAIDFALRHPDRVRGLVLIGTALSGAPSPDALHPDVQRLADAISSAEADNDGNLVNDLEAQLWLDGPSAPAGRVGGPARELFDDMNLTALAAVDPGEAEAPPSAFERLGSIAVPTLVIVGDLDLPHLVDRSAQIASAIAHAALVVLPGRAHLPQLEAPAEVAEPIRTFLLDLHLAVECS